MFKNTFQSGFISILYSVGSQPLKIWDKKVRTSQIFQRLTTPVHRLDCVTSRVRLFAHDCLIYREIHNPEDQLAFQKDLDILEQWANKWGMQFNPGKCNILSISRSTFLHRLYSVCGTVLNVHEARYLGINLSEDLQWGNHIRSIAAKSSSTLGLPKRNLSKCPQKLREQAYISLMRSRLEYCTAV